MSAIVDTLVTRFKLLEIVTDALESITFGGKDQEDAVKIRGVEEPIYCGVLGAEIGDDETTYHLCVSITEDGVNDVIVPHPVRQLIAGGVVREATPEEAIYRKEDEA